MTLQPSPHRRRIGRVAGTAALLVAVACGGHAVASAPTSPPPIRTDPGSIFVPVGGVIFQSAPASVVASVRTSLASKLPPNSVVSVDARSAIIAADQTAQVTSFSTTAGYAAYPTYLPLVLQVFGSGDPLVEGINTFSDAFLRHHLLWQDGRVIVDVASLDEGTAQRIGAALHDASGPPSPPTALASQDPRASLVPLAGYRYEEVPFAERGQYLRSMRLVEPDVAQAIQGYALQRVVPDTGPPASEPLAVVLAVSLDPAAVGWMVAGSGFVELHAGGVDKNPIKVKLGAPTIASTPDGGDVIAWLDESVALLVTAQDATVAAPVLAGLGAPGY